MKENQEKSWSCPLQDCAWGRCRTGRHGRSNCSWKSGQGLMASGAFCPWGQMFAKEGTTWLVVWHQAPQFSLKVYHKWLVDLTVTKGFIQAVLESLLWCPSVVIANKELTAQYETGQALISPFRLHVQSRVVGSLVISRWKSLFNDFNIGEKVSLYTNKQLYFKQFSLVWVQNHSISTYSV